jgi:hypothetical protein
MGTPTEPRNGEGSPLVAVVRRQPQSGWMDVVPPQIQNFSFEFVSLDL